MQGGQGGQGSGSSWGSGQAGGNNQESGSSGPDYTQEGTWFMPLDDAKKPRNRGESKWDAKATPQKEEPPLSAEQVAMRGNMQSSLAELSAKLLGKSAATKAGFVEEQALPAPAAPLNPFRSKPRAAPVAPEPEPPLMEPPMELPPQPASVLPGFEGSRAAQAAASEPLPASAPPMMMPPEVPPHERLWAPSADELASLNMPPGIAVRMIRQNRILANVAEAALAERHKAEMEAARAEIHLPSMQEILQKATEPAEDDNLPSLSSAVSAAPAMTNGSAPDASQVQAQAAAAQLAAAQASLAGVSKSLGGANASLHPDIKRAQAIATLSCYGLTDPTSQDDVTKAVQAVAAATGDQSAAVSLWHQMLGLEESPQASDASIGGLTEEQQLEVQQAAASAQYSQYWLQQQFQSQLAMFENQRLMATGDIPPGDPSDPSTQTGGSKKPMGRKSNTQQPMLPGDWTCPGCGDHQFARNRVCRFCGAARPLGTH